MIIPYSTLSSPPLSSPPISLTKSWSLATSLKKIYIENFIIRNYFKKDFLNFFSLGTISQSSNNHPVTFIEKFTHQFVFQALNEVSQSNIFLVFFIYFWSSKVNSIFIIIRIGFSSVNSILIDFFSSSSFPPNYF